MKTILWNQVWIQIWIQKGIVYFSIGFIAAFSFGAQGFAAISQVTRQISFDEAILEQKTIENSLKRKAANQTLEAQKSNLEAANARQMPQLGLEGQYRYQTNVPEISMANNLKIKLGENTNYSIGPVLSYSVYEGGQITAAINTQTLLAQSKERELEFVQQDERLQFSMKFLELLLQKEKTKIYYEAFLLAKKQFGDIQARFQNGASSKLDEIASEKEKEDQKVRFLQGLALFNQLLIEVLIPAGSMPKMPESEPIQAIDASIVVNEELKGIFAPNLVVHLVPKPSSADQSSPSTKNSGGVSTNPRLQSMQLQQESIVESIKTIDAEFKPKVRFFAKSTLEYPKTGTTDSYQQNMVGLNLSWNLFDFSRTQSLVAAQSGTALSQKWHVENFKQSLEIKMQQVEASLVQLKAQKEILMISQAQAKRISDLSYQSYLAGKISFSQVQAANLRQQESDLNLTLVKHNLELNRLQLRSLKGEL